jgi:Zn-dependent peptidase ImmA (M78 family)
MSLKQTNTEIRVRAARARIDKAFPGAFRDGALWSYAKPIDVEAVICELFKSDKIAIDFRSVDNLSEHRAHELLRSDYGFANAAARSNSPKLGFLHVSTERIIVFTNPCRGAASELFSRAHEAGHIIAEFIVKIRSRTQTNMFEAPFVENHDDGLESFADADLADDEITPALRTRLKLLHAESDARLREVIANSTGSELLAPMNLVREMGRDGGQGLEDRLMERFGLSRTAARYRIADIFPAVATTPIRGGAPSKSA